MFEGFSLACCSVDHFHFRVDEVRKIQSHSMVVPITFAECRNGVSVKPEHLDEFVTALLVGFGVEQLLESQGKVCPSDLVGPALDIETSKKISLEEVTCP